MCFGLASGTEKKEKLCKTVLVYHYGQYQGGGFTRSAQV